MRAAGNLGRFKYVRLERSTLDAFVDAGRVPSQR